ADGSLWRAAGIAALAAVVILAVRSAYVTTLLRSLARRARRGESLRGVIAGMQEKLDAKYGPPQAPLAAVEPSGQRQDVTRTGGPGAVPEARVGRIRLSLRRRAADIDYLAAERLGWREGTLLVWAGMRGVVTLAAAQTLPPETPSRSFLVLVAFGVAFGTLLVQGSTLPWVARRLGLVGQDTTSDLPALRRDTEQAA